MIKLPHLKGPYIKINLLSRLFQEIEKLKKDVEILKSSCKRLKDEADVHHETFETERASWLDEKEKVIRYQKQLQLNYVQVNPIVL